MRPKAMRIHTVARRARTVRRAPRSLRLSAGRRLAARVSPLERVMRRSAAVQAGRAVRVQVGVHLLLSTTVVRRTERGAAVPAKALAVPAPAPVPTLTRQLRTLASRHVLHERLVERGARGGASAQAPRMAFVTRVEQRQAAPHLQLTLLRASTAPVAAASAPSDAQQPASMPARAQEKSTRIVPPAPPLVLPAQELSRLTDHVIRQLDHRVLSWQERTGRV